MRQELPWGRLLRRAGLSGNEGLFWDPYLLRKEKADGDPFPIKKYLLMAVPIPARLFSCKGGRK